MGSLLSRSLLFVKRNAPTILTIVGGTGAVVTTVMAVKATPKALDRLDQAKEEKGDDLTTLEKVQVAGPVYIPSVMIGTGSLVCVFGANFLNKRSQAVITSAYMFLDGSYKEYKSKVAELYGENANAKVVEEIAKDKYNADGFPINENEHLFYDSYSGQYFISTLSKVRWAEYQLNRDLSMREYATLNEFYEYLEIDTLESGDELGWSTGMNFDYYWQVWIDFVHSWITLDDGRQCCIIEFFMEPSLGWDEY